MEAIQAYSHQNKKELELLYKTTDKLSFDRLKCVAYFNFSKHISTSN